MACCASTAKWPSSRVRLHSSMPLPKKSLPIQSPTHPPTCRRRRRPRACLRPPPGLPRGQGGGQRPRYVHLSFMCPNQAHPLTHSPLPGGAVDGSGADARVADKVVGKNQERRRGSRPQLRLGRKRGQHRQNRHGSFIHPPTHPPTHAHSSIRTAFSSSTHPPTHPPYLSPPKAVQAPPWLRVPQATHGKVRLWPTTRPGTCGWPQTQARTLLHDIVTNRRKRPRGSTCSCAPSSFLFYSFWIVEPCQCLHVTAKTS